jgi:phenylacetate-CoA ligase
MLCNKYLTLVELLRNERRPAQELTDIQNRKLRLLVHHAYSRVPFYRNRFDSLGIRPEDIRSVADLAALPIVTKQDIIDEESGQVVDGSVPISRLVERCTSGSSGIPFRFFVGRGYDDFCKAQFLRPYFSNGRSIFDTAMRFSSNPSPPIKWYQRLGVMREHRIMSDSCGDEMLAKYRRVKPDVLIGYSSTISVLADALMADREQFHRPRIVFTDSEVLSDFARDRIRAAFRAPIIDVYGTFETDNIAWQCSDGAAYHYAADCVILETVREGQRVAFDEPGELVCTVLNSLTMPFIRYNIGDIVTLSSRSCTCGRTLPLISAIEGRAMDRLTLPDGSRVSATRIPHEFKFLYDVVQEFQVIQETIEEFTVAISARRDLTASERERVRNTIRSTHPQARVTVQSLDQKQRRGLGKQRLFISRVQ